MSQRTIKHALVGAILLGGLGFAQEIQNADRALEAWMGWRSQLVYPEVAVAQSSQAYRQMAQTLAATAEATYPTAFYDKPLWNAAVHHAEMAYRQEPQNLDNARLLAQLYTTTQFWYPAYLLWASLDQQNALAIEDRHLAALSAAKMGLYRHRLGMQFQAMAYLEVSLRFEYNSEIDGLLKAVQAQRAVSSF